MSYITKSFRTESVIGIPCVNISYSIMTAANIVITRGEYNNNTSRGWIFHFLLGLVTQRWGEGSSGRQFTQFNNMEEDFPMDME